jgi:hypothetical protein
MAQWQYATLCTCSRITEDSAPQRLASSVGEKLVACRQILTAAGECEDDICTEGCFTKGD